MVKLDGPSLVGADATPVTSHLKNQPMAAFESDWIDLIQRGTSDLRDRIKERIKPAAQN